MLIFSVEAQSSCLRVWGTIPLWIPIEVGAGWYVGQCPLSYLHRGHNTTSHDCCFFSCPFLLTTGELLERPVSEHNSQRLEGLGVSQDARIRLPDGLAWSKNQISNRDIDGWHIFYANFPKIIFLAIELFIKYGQQRYCSNLIWQDTEVQVF